MKQLVAESVTVRFGRRVALDSVSFEAFTGLHGLMGPNGAGKTTLLRVAATLVNPQSGSVSVAGVDVAGRSGRLEARRRSGYVPQTVVAHPRMTVTESVEYALWLKAVPKSEWTQRSTDALDRVGLADRADERARSLSGGMLRRCGIAQAIAHDPEVLLLDEPTAGLDATHRDGVVELLVELGCDRAVVCSSHLTDDLAQATTITILDEGRVQWRGTPDDLMGESGRLDDGYRAQLRRAEGSDGDLTPRGPLAGDTRSSAAVAPPEAGSAEAGLSETAG